jgi:hypothetical protein
MSRQRIYTLRELAIDLRDVPAGTRGISIARTDRSLMSQLDLIMLDKTFNKVYQEMRSTMPTDERAEMGGLYNINFYEDPEYLGYWLTHVMYQGSTEGRSLRNVEALDRGQLRVEKLDNTYTTFVSSGPKRRNLRRNTSAMMAALRRLAKASMMSGVDYTITLLGEEGDVSEGILRL